MKFAVGVRVNISLNQLIMKLTLWFLKVGTVIFLLGYSNPQKDNYSEISYASCTEIPKPHYFLEIYKSIRSTEGCYVNHESDKGGETYGGVPRRFHPKWRGWYHVDKARPNYRHKCIEDAEPWVLDFYLTIWVNEGFEQIEDKELALNLFDFRIHSSPRTVTAKVNRVLWEMGIPPVYHEKGWVDERFNMVDANEFTLRLKIHRLLLFNSLVSRDPSQEVFYKGWTNRLWSI